ncbi:DUF4190 domain-containing protein [Pedosphaera parvula]|uniref:DUF4190 domain-containing protein n=1 Tax=Pedosphaera parvula (strain Ellin514) TaxID=320771 RepID=B9XHJ5_PEDPL|nr:DUF4190 domain-containing protein [Pedosphaera parvula]EEF60830.1 hypothetical protein Cflav_PD3688 [Pedosphaera parvula Ellin514]
MSEFKFACSNCGQNILSDTTQVGTSVTCPSCQTPLIVPNIPAGTSTAPPPSAPGLRRADSSSYNPPPPPNVTPVVEKTSGLAIASLVCSLSSFVICIGWLPGIICGHLAKAELRRNPKLKGSGLATAGLVIGYISLAFLILFCALLTPAFIKGFKRGLERGRQNRQPYIQGNN